jgi:acrylyl-CoA reductase (NADPH)
MTSSNSFPCFMVRKDADGRVIAGIESITFDDLPPGDVVVRVEYSSLNYKDALGCQGHPGVVRSFPHVPGIDCAGMVVESASPNYRPGDAVLITGYELGAGHWGGYSAYVRVPADWIVPLPPGLTVRDAMIYGTAGFTAAQCVDALVRHGLRPERGPVVVTGATGGVGCLAVAILAKLGFDVAAVTGKPDRHDWLSRLGAKTILGRGDVDDESDRPLLQAQWAGAVDTVGGRPLATVLRSVDHRGCIAACGLVAGAELNMTVYPFILRGVTMAGIDSAKCPRPKRLEMWRKLAAAWRVDLEHVASEVTFDELAMRVDEILKGRVVGRTLVAPSSKMSAG